jgi:hypothetical protein
MIQSCEVLLVRGNNTVNVSHITYGVVYTETPLFTVSSRVDLSTYETVLELTNLKDSSIYISTFTTVLGHLD